MGDISVQQRIERQRQRRQQRILESAESRLNKIKNFQAARRSPSPESKDDTQNTIAEHYPAPTDPRRRKYEMDRPLPGPTLDNDNNNATTEIVPENKSSADKYFNLLHLISMIWLAMLAMFQFISKHGSSQVSVLFHDPAHAHQSSNWVHYPVFSYFIILELILHFGRLVYQPDFHKKTHSIQQLNHLPTSLQMPAEYIIKYSSFFTNVYRDLFVVIFMVGFCSLCISVVQ